MELDDSVIYFGGFIVKLEALIVSLLVIISIAASAESATIDLVPIQDNTLYEISDRSPDGTSPLSNGAGSYLFTGSILTGDLRRALVAFDIAGSLPSGALITEVTLTMQMSKTIAGSTTVGVHRLTSDWGEGDSDAGGEEGAGTAAQTGDATWIHTFYPGSNWLAPGGDFVGAASSSQTVGNAGSYGWPSTPELVADVQSWLDNPSTNFGWLVMGNEFTAPSAKRFNSRENGSGVPTLTITYQAPVPSLPAWAMLTLVLCLILAGIWCLNHLAISAERRSRLH